MTKTASATFVALPICAPGGFPASICVNIAAHMKGFTSERTVMIACRWPVTGGGLKDKRLKQDNSWRRGNTWAADFPDVPDPTVPTKVPTYPSSDCSFGPLQVDPEPDY